MECLDLFQLLPLCLFLYGALHQLTLLGLGFGSRLLPQHGEAVLEIQLQLVQVIHLVRQLHMLLSWNLLTQPVVDLLQTSSARLHLLHQPGLGCHCLFIEGAGAPAAVSVAGWLQGRPPLVPFGLGGLLAQKNALLLWAQGKPLELRLKGGPCLLVGLPFLRQLLHRCLFVQGEAPCSLLVVADSCLDQFLGQGVDAPLYCLLTGNVGTDCLVALLLDLDGRLLLGHCSAVQVPFRPLLLVNFLHDAAPPGHFGLSQCGAAVPEGGPFLGGARPAARTPRAQQCGAPMPISRSRET
mmetsp:Transcript_140597/g.244760  ORF Transcript_140597/g.244760 Transcript_140597/m.244760 type:complete len:296 (+) Transcript_140597:1084-1971(+)